MLKTEQRTVGSTAFKVTQLGASAGMQLMVRLTKVLGPVLGELAKGGDSNGATNLMDVRGDALAGALQQLATHLTYEDLEYVCETLGAMTEIEMEGGKWVRLNRAMREIHFAGNYGELFRWLAFALEVNYSSFFGESGVGAALAKATAPPSSSPKT